METIVHEARRIRGELIPPGDKSIAHRALILGALARGRQVVRGLPQSADVQSTIACLRRLGGRVDEFPDGTVTGHSGAGQSGANQSGAWPADVSLHAGNSGTTARLLAGLVAGIPTTCKLDGDASLRQRPMARVAEPLRAMGAEIRTAPHGRLPMQIQGGHLTGIHYRLPVASAQVKSAVLIAGLQAEGTTCVEELMPTRDHTEIMLEAMGVPVSRDGPAVTVTGGSRPRAVEIELPGDFSAAAFFLAAATLMSGSEIQLPGTGVNPTRTGLLKVLQEMGADIVLADRATRGGEPVADIVACSAQLHGVEIGGAHIPSLIDELPLLAVLATQAEGVTSVRDAGELRLKESDRIAALAEGLCRLGADITAQEDGFQVKGPCRLHGGTVSSHGDHRIAMAMAVAGLVAATPVRITGSEAVSVSYPGFFEDLSSVVE